MCYPTSTPTVCLTRDLPVETLRHIGGYLDRSSLFSFSGTDRRCRLASAALRYQDVCIKFSSPETLNGSVNRCQDVLRSTASFQNVQHLRVVARELTTFCETIPDCGDRPLDIWKFCGTDGSISKLLTENEDWQSLTHLVKNLPALRKLTWACLEQIPPCIFNTIDEKTPQCRLYMGNFCLRSLVQPLSALLNIESKDLNVATAQCLRSIVMRRDLLESSEYTDYNPQAVMEMVSGGAPNLQAVSLL